MVVFTVILARVLDPLVTHVAIGGFVEIEDDHLECLRVDLGRQPLALGIKADQQITSVIDLDALDLPAECIGEEDDLVARLPEVHRDITFPLLRGRRDRSDGTGGGECGNLEDIGHGILEAQGV